MFCRDRLFEEDLDDSLDRGGNRIDRNGFEEALLKYYILRGWDASSKPTNKKLGELGLA